MSATFVNADHRSWLMSRPAGGDLVERAGGLTC